MYSIFDIALDSDIPLPELSEVETAKAFIRIRAGEDANSIPKHPEWFHHWKSPRGVVDISCAKLPGSYLLRFPGLVDFIVSQSGNSLHYYPKPSVPVESIRHLLLDQVVPRILGQSGRLVLHAAAVVISEEQTIAILGASGRGKSTLATSFHQNGARLITDDCLLLEERDDQVFAVPNYYGVRLLDDSARALFGNQATRSPVAHYSPKSRLRLHSHSPLEPKSTPKLSTIFVLTDPDENGDQDAVSIQPTQGIDDLMAIIANIFLLDISDTSLMARQFMSLGKLVSSGVNIYRLEYPRKHSMLPVVRSHIEAVL